MTNWITATGDVEASASTIADKSITSQIKTEVGNGGGWQSAGDGKATSNPSTSYQARANDDDSGGVMATVRSPSGSPLMSRSPNGSDIIMYQGMGIPLAVAANMGLVTRNPDGSFSDKEAPAALKDPTAQVRAKAPADKATVATDGVTFGETAEATLTELMGSQMPGDLIKTMDSVLLTGDVDAATIGRMASMDGSEPAEMAEKVATVWQGAYDAASDFMGIENGEAFQAFITSDTRRQADMVEAARNFFMHNKTEGLQTMADAYLPAMDRYEGSRVKAMLTEAGYQFADRPGGGVNVMVNGQPISWEVAVKQKIITFSRG
ncbi:hypothetical protein A8B83_16490 [Rhodobacteraceae bacterium EhC02]|nr:hypothetical protein A8B83_16490 [Rhodobacteraceae bacterium EhC02]